MLRLLQHRRSSSASADKPHHRRTTSDGTHDTEPEELSTLSAVSASSGQPADHHRSPGRSISGPPGKDRRGGRRVELLNMPGQPANSASTPVASGRKAVNNAGEDGKDTPVVDLLGLRPYDFRSSSPVSCPDDGSDSSGSISDGGTADAHIYASDQLSSLSPSSSSLSASKPTPGAADPSAPTNDDSLRSSTETNNLDSICTGDHVSAMLREYQGGGSRWDSTDRIGASYTAEMQANIFKANIKANKTLLAQIAEPDEVLTDTSDRPIRSRIQKKRKGKKSKQAPDRPPTPSTPADDNSSRRSGSVDSSSLKTCDIPVDQELLGDKTGWDEEMAAEAPAHFAEVDASPALRAARERAARREARRASLVDEVDDPHGLNEARFRSRLECGQGDGMDGSRGSGFGGSPGRMSASVHSASTAPVVNTSDVGRDGASEDGDGAKAAASGPAEAPVLMDNRSLEKLLWDNNSQDGAYNLNLTHEDDRDGPMRNLAGAVKAGAGSVGRTLGQIRRRASDAIAPAIVVEREDIYSPSSGKLVTTTGEASADAGDDVDGSYNISARLSALGGLPGFNRKGSADSMWSAFGRGSEKSEGGMETGEGSSESGGAFSRKASGDSSASDDAQLGRGIMRTTGRRSGSGSDRAFVASSGGPTAGADSDEENQDIDGALNGNGDYKPTRSLLGNIRGASFQRNGRRSSRRNSATPYVDEDGTTFDEYGDLSSLTASNGTSVYRPGLRTIGRCCAVLLVLVVVIIGSTLVGVLVPKGEGKDEEVAYIPIPPSVESLDVEITELSMATPYTTSELKNMVVSVESHCTPTKLSSTTGSWECEQICHSHLCCFDPKGHGWCGGDMNKLCPIFKGCAVLAAPDLALMKEDKELEEKAKEKAKVEIVDILPSFEKEKKEHNGDGYVPNALPEEKDMGWLDIRRKRTSVYCSPTNLETTNGRAQCYEVCSQHFCCVDSDPSENCQKDPSKTCDVYETCQNYVLLEDRDSIRDGAFESHTLINIDGSEVDVDAWIAMNEDLPLPPGAPRPEGGDKKSEKHLDFDLPDFDEDIVDEFGPPPGDDFKSDPIVP